MLSPYAGFFLDGFLSQPPSPAARKLSVRLADCTAVPTMAVLYTSVRRCRVREYRTGSAGGTSFPCSGHSIGGVQQWEGVADG